MIEISCKKTKQALELLDTEPIKFILKLHIERKSYILMQILNIKTRSTTNKEKESPKY